MEDVGIEAGAPLATHLGALLEARRDSSLPADPEPAFAAGAARVLELKAAHRRLCDATDTLREAAAEAKTQLDTSSLQLQNLLYERQHYEKEISSCRSWQSAFSDEQIALVPLEEFASHPLAAEGGLSEESDPHQLMLNRLKHEVAYRQEHVKQLDAVKARRDALASDVAQKRSMVAGLEGEISKLLAAARAVQQQYAIRSADSGRTAGEPAVDQAAAGAAAAAAEQQQAGGDVAMQEAGQI